jgi:hypothetical protein
MPAVGYTMMILEDMRTPLALLDLVYESTVTFWNVGNYLPIGTVSRPGIADSSATQILLLNFCTSSACTVPAIRPLAVLFPELLSICARRNDAASGLLNWKFHVTSTSQTFRNTRSYRLLSVIISHCCSPPDITLVNTICNLPFYWSSNAGRDISVGIATRYALYGPGIESRCVQDFPHPSRPALGPSQPPIQWVPGYSRG